MFHIVNITAIETTESGPVHLIAVTRGGLRLYFSTLKPHTNSRLVFSLIFVFHYEHTNSFSFSFPSFVFFSIL